jgi:oligopeptide/dipeptide ABC transporter ATP-binding protein
MSLVSAPVALGHRGAGEPPLLRVGGLSIVAGAGTQAVTLVDDVSLHVAPRETLGIVGESGSGKTVTAMAIGGLLPAGLRIAGGTVEFAGQDLTTASPEVLQSIRGAEIGFVFQDPQNSLDPVFSIGSQLTEAIRAHQHLSRSEARSHAVGLLDRVGIANADKRMADYPYQFSGGMAQRVMMAIALCCNPKLLIADEPTTALDVTMQAQILDLLESLKVELGLSVLLISHDLGVVADMADRVAVMYGGQMVEQGETAPLFSHPRHPYLDALIAAQPEEGEESHRLATIPGRVPSAAQMPDGCRFHPRCSFAQDQCRTDTVALVDAASSPPRQVRCHRSDELTLEGVRRQRAGHAVSPLRQAQAAPAATSATDALFEVRDLTKVFVARRGFLGRGKYAVTAVDHVSFDIRPGETLGMVGETGAGKSTVGRLVLGLESPTSGVIRFRGTSLRNVEKRPPLVRRDLQVIFQNPYASLNPSMTVLELVAEPIDVHGRLPQRERTEAVAVLLASVGLGSEYLRRYIYEMSGGQLQRIAIARALSMNPKLIVLDEPISSLDVSTQAQVVNLLEDLRDTHGLSYLFIGHNLAVVSHISDRLAILYGGQIVETGGSETVYRRPRHPYTRALIGAMLSTDPARRRVQGPKPTHAVRTEAPVDAALAAPDSAGHGCVYASRCPLAEDLCRREAPPDVVCADGTIVRCHFAEKM